MQRYWSLVFVISVILFSGCEKRKEPCPIFFPVKPNAKLSFISYVTNQRNEILHPFDYFDRRYIYTDTLATQLVHYYVERNKKAAFFTDDSCTIWHRTAIDLGALAVNCGFIYQDSVELMFWKPVIKVNKGVDTRWKLQVNKTFVARTSDGTEHLLRYEFSGSAQYKGWSEVIVPENRTKKLKVQHVQWEPIQNLLWDETTKDTLYFQNGKASDYFEPELGLIRSIFDYDVLWKGKPPEFRKSTWELYQVLFPAIE